MEHLKRKADIFLEDWKSDAERMPLIIKGARQVGKTKGSTGIFLTTALRSIRSSKISPCTTLP